MGQGLYRCVGFGCLNPPEFEFDDASFTELLITGNETDPYYAMVPFGIDDSCLQRAWNLPQLPAGLPHVEDRKAIYARRCQWWPNIGKKGVWVSARIEAQWELVRREAFRHGYKFTKGKVVFVCDWD